ncbi:MAG: prepilin-type N-terminal cleavage/methylation domain-containing protein [Sulfurovum sp.]|nr:prepilin-type N-terminal cleavage/methylation domain-containing protein [Sulfurovum sp.]
MRSNQRLSIYSKRKAFSLMELMIVIFILGLVAYMGFSGVELDKQKPKALTPMNLKKNIVQSSLFSKHATLLCVNKCKQCYLRKDISSSFEPYENNIDLGEIKAYTLDASDSLVRIEYQRYKDKKICLVMDFYANGSSTQIILEDEEHSYFLPALFGTPKQFDSPEDAKEYWFGKTQLVSNSGEFY